VAKTKP